MTKPADQPVATLRLAFEMPGTAEGLWTALATGVGNRAWFLPAEIDGREGGRLAFHMGEGMDSPGTVRCWEPPRRLVYDESAWTDKPGFGPLVTEYRVEPRGGGSCVVRVTTCAYATADAWDQDFVDGFFARMERGWAPYFDNLRLYLTYFAGQEASNFEASTTAGASRDEAWQRLLRALGLEGATPGDTVEPVAGAPRLAGVVETVGEGNLLLRIDRPAPGTCLLSAFDIGGGRAMAGARGYLFGDEAPVVAVREQRAWEAWLGQLDRS